MCRRNIFIKLSYFYKNIFIKKIETEKNIYRNLQKQTMEETRKTLFMNIPICFREIGKIAGIYFLWILLHYLAAHSYVYWCASSSLGGFILSPFLTAAPHCQALRWGINQGANNITLMWSTAGTWILLKLAINNP
jgi:hypothetical protein